MHHAHTSPPATNNSRACRRFAGVDMTLTRNVRTTQPAGTVAPPKLTPPASSPPVTNHAITRTSETKHYIGAADVGPAARGGPGEVGPGGEDAEVGEGGEDKPPLGEPRGGDVEVRVVVLVGADEEDVHVEGAGPPPLTADPVGVPFEALRDAEQVPGAQAGVEGDHRVEVVGLGGPADRGCLVHRGHRDDGDAGGGLQAVDRALEVGDPVPEVRADPEIRGTRHRSMRTATVSTRARTGGCSLRTVTVTARTRSSTRQTSAMRVAS